MKKSKKFNIQLHTRMDVFKEFYKDNKVYSPASFTWAMENILGFKKEDILFILKLFKTRNEK